MSAASSSRYNTILKLAAGGMATVWVGTVRGALGFRQLVAIKKPHPHLLEDASYRNELVAEARLASLIHHANVVDVRDVEVDGESISLIMDYIEGASLGELVVAAAKLGRQLPPRVAVRIALDALAGLHAAHELVDERGRHVGLVHRDVSPQNIVVGIDGLARVADFGVAKFSRKNVESSEGSLKGKLAYMAPEYIRGEAIDRRFDVFALGIVLWETLAGKRLFRGTNEPDTIRMLLEHQPESLATAAPAAAALDGVIATALARPLDQRFQNARAMAAALESTALAAGLCGGHTEVIATLKELVGAGMEERRMLIRSKLANEPSVASLMGVPPLVVAEHPVGDHEARQVAEPNPMNATQPVATEPMAAAATLFDPRTMAPSTLPMTPRMEQAPAARTMPSAEASAPAAAAQPAQPAVNASTLASATPGSDPSMAARLAYDARPDVQLSFNDPSARTAHELDPPPELPRSKTLPVVIGVAMAIVAAVAIVIVATRARSTNSTVTGPAASVTAEPPPVVAATTELPPPLNAAPAKPTPSASATAVTGARRPGHPKPTASAAAPPPSPGPSPVETAKKPPPNPYATE